MHELEIEPGNPDEFCREVEAARFRRERQRPLEGAASLEKIYVVACAFLIVLIIIIVLAIWFSVTAQSRM